MKERYSKYYEEFVSVDHSKDEPGLYFEKIGEKWGEMGYPYPTATSEEMTKLLLKGGNLSAFIFPSRAIANLVAKIFEEGSFDNSLIISTNRLVTSRLMCHLKESFSHLNPKWADHLIVFNSNSIHFNNGFKCDILEYEDAQRRGFHIKEKTILFIIPSSDIKQLAWNVILPILEIIDDKTRIYVVDVLSEDESTKKRKEMSLSTKHQGWWYSTLKMYAFGDYYKERLM